jgi:hypothetical protein
VITLDQFAPITFSVDLRNQISSKSASHFRRCDNMCGQRDRHDPINMPALCTLRIGCLLGWRLKRHTWISAMSLNTNISDKYVLIGAYGSASLLSLENCSTNTQTVFLCHSQSLYYYTFVEPQGSFPCSQQPPLINYPDPDASSPHLSTLFSWDPL